MPDPITILLDAANGSPIFSYRWRDRGVAPVGYLQGMALSFARVYCRWVTNEPVALAIAKPAVPGSDQHDALVWLADELNGAGLSAQTALIQLFTVMIGLGMRESSGRYCEGRDMTVNDPTSTSAEAGLFQSSWDLSLASPMLHDMLSAYAGRSCFLDQYKIGVVPRADELECVGEGDGAAYQQLAKACPAFATEFAALGLRLQRTHWGPIVRREVELRPEAGDMLLHVQAAVVAYGITDI